MAFALVFVLGVLFMAGGFDSPGASQGRRTGQMTFLFYQFVSYDSLESPADLNLAHMAIS